MSPRAKIVKTKTFGGCWTCRRRKVKCDNLRPRCRRCGDTCEGYDVDLYWLDDANERPCSVKRQAMAVYDPNLPVACDPVAIDRMLDQLDDLTQAGRKAIVGPFTAFEVENTSLPGPTDAEPELESMEMTESSLEIVRANLSTPSMYVDSTAAELMDNYIRVVANVLQPANHPQNPYSTIYVPRAVESGALVVGGGKGSRGSKALFHALLAVSAFHLRRHHPDKHKYERLAQVNRGQAVTSLQKALTSGEGVGDCDTVLSAMLSLVSIDLMQGDMTEFWIHLSGCDRLLQSLNPGASPRDGQLRTICAFMNTLSRSTNPYPTPKPYTMGQILSIKDLIQHSPFHQDNDCLEFIYGTTATLASYLHTAITLAENLSFHPQPSPPAPLTQARETLKQAIHTWTITQEPLSSTPRADHETRSLITCHILAFHAAVVIYYHVALDQCDDNDTLRYYKRACVSNLIAAEALKSSSSAQRGWSAMAPIVWPGFIAACEADPDERPLWRAWWTGVQRYCIGSIQTLWGVVQEVWWCRDAGMHEVPGWKGVLRRRGKRVMSGG
ncbi:C6 zinc finger domain protein [Aspergillus steynii IBT 23096]|uniref:C6 zinc finger domain protein n=1 Tax=Aspergillus steynii IBT 23096 TaxID=1392250 RepID=A0A2I2G166_9EURO|nr:C6 zinc finger domain protein [Aspergillus steynii IBT 23096]PLB46586.1 C6 zinc finger domain protein [Aspergillus steynii IBT 23096]